MSLAVKLQQGGTAPSTYTMYGKTYNFNDLQRSADEGFDQYLSGLRRGEKDEQQFREAYQNIMSGIKDGTITFQDGHYHDSLGRYTNSKNKKKDYYGLVANYIYSKQGKSGETENNWDGSTTIGKDLTKAIFNSDKGDVQDFIDLDPIDKKTGKRGIRNRANYLADRLQELANSFDSRYSGYSQADKQNALNNINTAIKALRDGSIDSGDYLALSRAASGLDYRGMFGTESSGNSPLQVSTDGVAIPQQVPQEPPVESQQSNTSTQPTQEQFQAWVDQNFPKITKAAVDQLRIDPMGQWTKTKLGQYMDTLGRDGTLNLVRNLLYNKQYIFKNDDTVKKFFGTNPLITNRSVLAVALSRAQKNNWLEPIKEGEPFYYIPGSENQDRKSGWAVNINNGKMQEVSWQSVPSLYKKMQERFFTQYKKEGGILKYQKGNPIQYNNIYASEDNADTGYNTYLNRIFQAAPVIDWMKSNYSGTQATPNYAEYVKRNVDQRYQYGINKYNNDAKYTANEGVRTFNTGYQNGGNTLNYTLFGNSTQDYDNKTGGAAYNLINFSRPNKSLHTGDSYQTDTSKAYIDNALGLQTYSRVASLTDPGIKTGGFGSWGDYWKSQGNTGAYYYIANGDTSGQGQWIPTSDTTLNGYQPFDPAKPAEQTPQEPQNPGSEIDLTKEKPKKPVDLSGVADRLRGLAPDIIGANRLFYSLRTNNRVADTIRRSLNPVLKDTYERYSPVTGKFSEMQFRNRQAAVVNRQANRPYTSDASLQLAGSLDANRQAADLQAQGFLADDAEIKRTQAEALARQEDNMARRSEVANWNRASINQTNRDRAELEATRLKSNWQSTDNFLAGEEARMRQNYEIDKARRQQFALQVAQDDVNNQYQDFLKPYKKAFIDYTYKNPDANPYTSKEYTDYVQAMENASRWKNAQLLGSHAKVYGYSYKNPLYGTPLAKHGGRLTPRSMNLINKVIRNESNT